MLVVEAKLHGTDKQYLIIDEMIRKAKFIRNSCIRYWIDNCGVGQYDLSKLCAVLAKEYEWANKLNSMARQPSAERAWAAIKRFYDNCKAKKQGLKGFPRFKKHSHSVEYKTSGWKLSPDRQALTFTDKFEVGTFKLIGTRDLNFYQIEQIKRVRVVRRESWLLCTVLHRRRTFRVTRVVRTSCWHRCRTRVFLQRLRRKHTRKSSISSQI